MEELYRDTLKQIADTDYGKEVLYYCDDGEWYNRDTCTNQSDKEACEWILNRILPQLNF